VKKRRVSRREYRDAYLALRAEVLAVRDARAWEVEENARSRGRATPGFVEWTNNQMRIRKKFPKMGQALLVLLRNVNEIDRRLDR
jgi:hypothetical protein